MELGHYNDLSIVRFTDHGAILDAGEGKEILMPKNYTTEEMKSGDVVHVFVYLDQSDRPVATTETPLVEVGGFAYLRVAWTNRFGAFMNWGLMKDLFVPFSEQRHHFMQDKSYIIYVYVDSRTGRIVGTSKLDRCFSEESPDLHAGDEVRILIWKQTDLGYKVIVNNLYEGLVYQNEIFTPIHIGDSMDAVVKNVRPDGKLDIALQHDGRQLVDDLSKRILEELQQSGDSLSVNDESSPLEISEHFGVSKKAFKRAIGNLYRRKLVLIENGEIKLNTK